MKGKKKGCKDGIKERNELIRWIDEKRKEGKKNG